MQENLDTLMARAGLTEASCAHAVPLVSKVGGPSNYCALCEALGVAYVLPGEEPDTEVSEADFYEAERDADALAFHAVRDYVEEEAQKDGPGWYSWREEFRRYEAFYTLIGLSENSFDSKGNYVPEEFQ